MQRIHYGKVAPKAFQLLLNLENYKEETDIEESLIHLVKIRASQLNKCAFCLDMHTKEARQSGETEQRIYCLSAWRETNLYSPREKAALQLTEAITHISEKGVPDPIYEEVRKHFDEKQTIDLVFIIITINSWNRLSITNKNQVT